MSVLHFLCCHCCCLPDNPAEYIQLNFLLAWVGLIYGWMRCTYDTSRHVSGVLKLDLKAHLVCMHGTRISFSSETMTCKFIKIVAYSYEQLLL